VLQAMSPVWDVMINELPRNSNSQVPRKLFLPTTSAKAFEIVMNVAYYKMKKIPTRFKTADLVSIAILCEQHELSRFLKQHTRFWSACLNSLKGINRLGLAQRMAVSWTFGLESVFSQAFLMVVNMMQVDNARWWEGTRTASVNPEGRILDISMLEPEIIGKCFVAIYHIFR
jgi:hypothetical protein